MHSLPELVRILLVFGWLRGMCCAAGGDGDEQVLLSLKQGLSPGALQDWIPGTNFCNWTGIQCDRSHPQRVQSIILPNRGLHGSLSPLLGRLDYLQVLNFDQNNLTGSIPATLENCSRLTNISLGSNLLTGRIPERLDRLVGLERLDLWNNQLQGTVPASIGNCSQIDYLSLGQNFLTGSLPPELGKLTRLVILRLFTNGFTGSFPGFFTNCTEIQIISLRNNSLSGPIPREVSNWKSLQQLRIQSNFFDGELPPEIGNMSSLYYIDISSNRLTGSIPGEIGRLSSLQELYLNNNSFTGRIPEELIGCPSLGTINLADNRLGGPLPEKLGELKALMNLTLNHNAITGAIPRSFGELKLINLDLSHNLLSGSLPPSLGGLNALQISFNLAFNSFTGQIPPWIGNFRVVQSISLQSNSFTGEIPVSLSQCVGLQSLDLSWNNLTGVIPSSLASLDYLTAFNVSMNRLTGRVLSEGQFGKFTSSSYLGNPGLCGGALSRACNGQTEDGQHRKGKGVGHNARIYIISACLGGFVCLGILTSAWLAFRCCYNPRGVDVDPLHEESDSDANPVGPLTAFTSEELRAMTENFSESKLIGVGGFCRVYKGELVKMTVAVKLLRSDMPAEVRKSFHAELRTLGQVKHRRLVQLLGYCWSRDVKALVLEYMPNGSLEKLLKDGRLLDWRARMNVALGVAQGIEYLHHGFDSPIIHCDLKPANILLDSEFEPHVADFGISKIAQADEHASVSAFRCSIGYTAPEYGSSANVSTRGDVYSFGIILLELLTGKSPTSGMFGITSSLQQWVRSASELSQVVDTEMLHLLREPSSEAEMRGVMELALMCTSYVASERPSMRRVLTTLDKLVHGNKLFTPMELLLNSPSPYVRVQW